MASTEAAPAGGGRTIWLAAGLAFVGLLALAFIGKYVLHYFLDVSPAAYLGFWPRRVGLVLHISFGSLALALGPLQFWTGARSRGAVHRWTGRLFLISVAAGSAGGLYLAVTNTL